MTHFAKNPAGAVLEFGLLGYPASLFDAFESAARSDSALSAKDLDKALALLALARSWEPFAMADAEPPRGMIGLRLPLSAKDRSDDSLRVDGAKASAGLGLARQFHAGRPFLNALAKTRAWLGSDGLPLSFAPVFSHALSLGSGAAFEEASASNLMGSQTAFALFSPAQGGYFEMVNASRWSLKAPMSRAKLFESAKAAKSFASLKRMRSELSVVVVSVRATRVFELAPGGGHDPLLLAIARAEAAELRALVKDEESARLRARLAALEAGSAPSGAPARPPRL